MRKSFLAGCIFCLLGSQILCAQDLINVSQNKFTYRPVVKNNRVLWFETNNAKLGIGKVSLYLFENGKNKLITEEASALFPGWPDLDNAGNIAFMKNMGRSHEVFLYDGAKEIQITNNPTIYKLPIEMGLATDKVHCGYPRIHNSDIVFKNKWGHIYLYRHKTKTIKKITTDASQIANLGDDDSTKASTGIAAPGNAHVKYFEFDGNHIVWMHENRGSGNKSTVSIYMAKATDGFIPKLISSFDAWVPNNGAVLPGKLWNPFFKACNGNIIWQYYLPSQGPNVPPAANLPKVMKDYGANLDDVHIGFYDSTGAAHEISKGTYVTFQSVRVTDGKAIWWQIRKEGEGKNIKKYHEVMLYEKGDTTVIASYPEPPKHAATGNTYWESILDAEIMGGDVFWVMGQVKCFQQYIMPVTKESYCMYTDSKNIGFFRQSFSTEYPFWQMDAETFSAGGEFDRGLYAFFSDRSSPSQRDISAMNLYGNVDSSNSMVTLIDWMTPDLKKLDTTNNNRKQVTDVFSISYDPITVCGESGRPDEITLESFTLDVSAEKQRLSRLEDIQSVILYHDVNGNRMLDSTTDKILGKRNGPLPAEVIFTFSGDALKIEQGKREYFLIEMEIKKDVCPCGRYKVTVQGNNLGFKKTGSSPVIATGQSIGGLFLPAAEIIEIKGDEQIGLLNQNLPEKLTAVYKNFPSRCGQAKFTIIKQPPEKGAFIIGGKGEKATELVVEFTRQGDDAKAEVILQMGKKAGIYKVEASIVMSGGNTCKNGSHIFKEYTGDMIVQILDLNNPDYYNAVIDDSNPAYTTWKATMSGDIDKLSVGGEGREGALADGTSMLLIRAKLTGFKEPPPGDINLSISGNDNIGHLSRGLGEPIPAYSGGNALVIQWVKTKSGVYGFALYTPPKNFGFNEAPDRNVNIKTSYTIPGSANAEEIEQDITLMKPPIAFIHGIWSGEETWGPPYHIANSQFEIHFIDYAEKSSMSFSDRGPNVQRGIENVIKSLRKRKIAATRINVVGHSMGGLVARQFFADNHGKNFHRKDNFGKGDIYKLVTLGTPHFGSPLAWLTVKLRDMNYSPFVLLAQKIGKDIESGAIDALCPGSRALMGLGETHIPTHTVRAWNFDSNTDALTWEHFYELLKKELKNIILHPGQIPKASPMALLYAALKYMSVVTGEVLLSSLYSSDKTDMLVTLVSQGGGIHQGANNVFSKTIHFATGYDLRPDLFSETVSDEIAAYIFSILNRDYDDINYFSPKLPKPDIQDDSRSCK